MRWPHPGIIVLVCGGAAIDVAAAFHYDHSRANVYLLLGLMMSQNGLLWFWAALGTARFVVRFTLPGIVLLAFTAVLGWDGAGDREVGIVVLFGATAVILLAVLMPMRIAGRWLVWRPQNGLPRREKAQFSLLSMMEMTAGVGVLAALSKLALAPSDMPRRELTLFLLLSPALSSIVLLMSWALLRNRFRWLLFCAAVVASAATAFLTNAIVGDSRNDTTDIILTHAALLLGYLVVCRLCGYRLVRAEQRRTDHAM
jgi:hypothetical protein